MIESPLNPAFSAKILGIISKDFPNYLTEYYSSPSNELAYSSNFEANSIWIAPAPATNLASLHKFLYAFTPSSIALSISSNKLFVLPLKTIVANLQSSLFLSKTHTF